MTAIIRIEEAQADLKDVIARLAPGDEVVITENHKPIAKLVSGSLGHQHRPAPGLGKGMITIVSEDDDHLKDFAEYMP